MPIRAALSGSVGAGLSSLAKLTSGAAARLESLPSRERVERRLYDYCPNDYIGCMADSGRRRRFDSPQQEAYLALWRTYDRLRAVEDELFVQFDLTAQQYNLLRLLRAVHPEAVPTLSLPAQLVSRAPDVTRMLDRLEERGLIARARSEEDRRAVLVAITEAGLALLKRLAEPLRKCHDRQLGHLSVADVNALIQLLRKARAPHEPAGSPWK